MGSLINSARFGGAAAITWNPGDKAAGLTLSGGNLTFAGTATANAGVRANVAKTTGKWYFEVHYDARPSGDVIAGWAKAAWSLTASLAITAGNVAFKFLDGQIYVNGVAGATWDVINVGDICCIAVDLDNSRVWVRKNNGNWNASGAANPATNTGGTDISAVTGVQLYPAAGASDNGTGGTAAFVSPTYTIPSGFTAAGA